MKRKNRKKKVSGNFTNATDLQNRFFAEGEERRKSGNKKDGDSGYWSGGRCNWGGSHNLQEDCEALTVFFNSASSIADDVGEIKLAANEQIFNQKKQALISKIKELNSKCNTSESYSVAAICCIWNDYFGSFLKPFLNTFSAKLTRQLNEVEKLEPRHQKELLQLEQEAQQLQSSYEENVKKANDPNTSPEDKTKFLLLASQIAEKAKRLKQKISRNPLADLSRFSNLDELEILIRGNVPKSPPTGSGSRSGSSSGSSPTNFPTNSANPFAEPQDWFQENKHLIIFAGIAGLAILYLYSQRDEEENYSPHSLTRQKRIIYENSEE